MVDTDALIEERQGRPIPEIVIEKGWSGFRAAETEVVVQLADADGQGVAEPTAGSPDVTLDAADLGAPYLGTFTFSELARVGRVVEGTPGALARADTLFAAGRAPRCSTMF